MKMTRAIAIPANNRFKNMLVLGCFPEVAYSTEDGWETYMLMQFSLIRSRFMKTLDNRIKNQLMEPAGAFTRKRSKEFLKQVNSILENITEEEVYNCPERFKTMWD